MNSIALLTVALGILLLLVGMVLIIKRIKIAGIATCLLGAGVVALPFVITLYLGPNL
jgi:hypothetical protein